MSRRRRRRRKRRNPAGRLIALVLTLVVAGGAAAGGIWYYAEHSGNPLTEYADEKYNADLYRAEPFSETLCVSAENVALDGFTDEPSLHAAGLFNLNERSVEYGYRLYDKLYPASTTKLMTAYLALKYGKLEDMVTVTDSVTGFAIDEVVCGLYPGGQVKLYDLLCGLLLKSGNDCGVAIAEYISGSVEAFAELMNEEAKELGATGTHFVNPHGLHEDDHYTTAYDLYLIFNACIQNDTFKEIISMSSYTMSIGDAAGNTHSLEVLPTNYYSLGKTEAPEGIKVFGGKTGTTDQARRPPYPVQIAWYTSAFGTSVPIRYSTGSSIERMV